MFVYVVCTRFSYLATTAINTLTYLHVQLTTDMIKWYTAP